MSLGEHIVEIKLNAGVNATVKVNVLSEEGAPEAPVEATTEETPAAEEK